MFKYDESWAKKLKIIFAVFYFFRLLTKLMRYEESNENFQVW